MTTVSQSIELPRSPTVTPATQGTQPLTTVVPIIPGHRQKLQQVLAALSERIAAGGPTPLEDIGTVHFARWVVLPDDADGGSLLFASNFDGSWDNYIEDFAANAAQSFDAIYSNCVGWPEGGATDVYAFKARAPAKSFRGSAPHDRPEWSVGSAGVVT